MIRSKRVLFLFRLLVGGVFIWAGVLKVGDPLAFAQTIKNYQAFPHDLVFVIALVLPWVEVLSGVGLIAGVLKRSSAFIAAVLLAGFIALVGSALLRGIDTSCGCFGSLSSRADLRLMLMDAVLCLMAVSVFANARPGNESATGPSRSR